MKITVKILQGQECNLNVSQDITVLELKQVIETLMQIPIREQKLLLLGKPLFDDKLLKDCGLKDGSKLNLVRSRGATQSSVSNPQQTIENASQKSPLREELLKFLLRQEISPSNANKIVEEFMKEFYKSVRSLSVDDLERIAKVRLQEENATVTS